MYMWRPRRVSGRVSQVLRTCLKRDGTLQPQACMIPSSRRMCSRTCRYCSRRCSRRANSAESLRRDATPLLASLKATGREGVKREKSEALAAWPASSKRQREMKRWRGEEENKAIAVELLALLKLSFILAQAKLIFKWKS